METFFGHMKDDLDYKEYQTLAELRERIEQYITYYNVGRYQWSLKNDDSAFCFGIAVSFFYLA
jgi:putative transposase